MADLAAVLARGLAVVATLDRGLERARTAAARVVGAALTRGLTAEERARLGVGFYDARFVTDAPTAGLWTWERDWFARRVASPPARLLLGGAGGGREAVPLAAAGYRVCAFEPAPRHAAACAARLGTRGRALAASYEDVSRAVLDGAGGPAIELASERFDAVLFGWGSLTHVIAPAERARALEAAARLCPEGPILASFWLSATDRPFVNEGRAGELGHRVGEVLARLRRLAPDDAPECVLGWEYGFAHVFTRAEIEDLAARLGRAVVWEPAAGGYPHVTLLPPGVAA